MPFFAHANYSIYREKNHVSMVFAGLDDHITSCELSEEREFTWLLGMAENNNVLWHQPIWLLSIIKKMMLLIHNSIIYFHYCVGIIACQRSKNRFQYNFNVSFHKRHSSKISVVNATFVSILYESGVYRAEKHCDENHDLTIASRTFSKMVGIENNFLTVNFFLIH